MGDLEEKTETAESNSKVKVSSAKYSQLIERDDLRKYSSVKRTPTGIENSIEF
jgi:hypothetical protein